MIICRGCGQANEEGSVFCTGCNAFLEWTGQSAALPDEGNGVAGEIKGGPPAVSQRSSGPARGRDQPARALVTTLSEGMQSVEPGGQVVYTLEIRNVGDVVDELSVEVLGDVAAWAEIQPPSLNLMPGTGGVVTIRIRPPRAPQVRSGWVNFGVGVRSKEHPEASVVERGAVDVAPFIEFSVDLSPKVARGARAATFAVRGRNEGNQPLRLRLAADDPEQALSFESSPPSIQVDPGASWVSSLKARVTQPFWFGTTKRRPFQVQVTSSDRPARTLEGAYLQAPLLPIWLPPLVVACAVIAVVAGAMLLSRAGGGGGPTPTPTAAGQGAPNIGGQYRLGPGSPRIITLTPIGQDRYTIEETTSTPWPFHGTVSWTSGQHFQGTATFDASRATMRVVLDRQPDGTLDTRYEFLTDENGVATNRVDPHLLVPYP